MLVVKKNGMVYPIGPKERQERKETGQTGKIAQKEDRLEPKYVTAIPLNVNGPLTQICPIDF